MPNRYALGLRPRKSGKDLGHHVFLKDTILIGRSPEADLFLDDPGVSRQHAKIVQKDGHYELIDYESTNGTKVNGTRVGKVSLCHGDVVEIQEIEIDVEVVHQGQAVVTTSDFLSFTCQQKTIDRTTGDE